MKKYHDDFIIDSKHCAGYQLSYIDDGKPFVQILKNGDPIASLLVYTDKENSNREYVCINYGIVYLDTLKQEK